jgi:hypothetical protein
MTAFYAESCGGKEAQSYFLAIETSLWAEAAAHIIGSTSFCSVL